jgi:hypothetical protein
MIYDIIYVVCVKLAKNMKIRVYILYGINLESLNI